MNDEGRQQSATPSVPLLMPLSSVCLKLVPSCHRRAAPRAKNGLRHCVAPALHLLCTCFALFPPTNAICCPSAGSGAGMVPAASAPAVQLSKGSSSGPLLGSGSEVLGSGLPGESFTSAPAPTPLAAQPHANLFGSPSSAFGSGAQSGPFGSASVAAPVVGQPAAQPFASLPSSMDVQRSGTQRSFAASAGRARRPAGRAARGTSSHRRGTGWWHALHQIKTACSHHQDMHSGLTQSTSQFTFMELLLLGRCCC